MGNLRSRVIKFGIQSCTTEGTYRERGENDHGGKRAISSERDIKSYWRSNGICNCIKGKKFNRLSTWYHSNTLVVAVLFGVKLQRWKPLGFLASFYCSVNGLTAILLGYAVIAVKNWECWSYTTRFNDRLYWLLSLAFLFVLWLI